MSETVQSPTAPVFKREKITTSNGSSIQLYGGSVPFSWTLEVYLEEEVLGPDTHWFITLHINSQGTHQQVFRSATVELLPDQITQVPFPRPGDAPPVVPPGEYGIKACTAQLQVEQTIAPATIGVQLVAQPNVLPFVKIVDTEVTPVWLIGARHIFLTDPPLRSTPPN